MWNVACCWCGCILLPCSHASITHIILTYWHHAPFTQVILAPSILSTEQVLTSLPIQRLRRNTLFVDVLSVKVFPKQLMMTHLPPEVCWGMFLFFAVSQGDGFVVSQGDAFFVVSHCAAQYSLHDDSCTFHDEHFTRLRFPHHCDSHTTAIPTPCATIRTT